MQQTRSTRRPLGLFGPVALVALLLLVACSGTGTSSSTTTGPTSTTTSSAITSAGSNCAEAGPATTVAYARIDGVDPTLVSLDVHAPDGVCDAPVVMWVHGGGYRVGDKSQQMDDKVRLFNDLGWILVSVNYRLTVPGDPASAQYPDHFDDVAATVAWVHDQIGAYGGDPARIALLGHSAGADIVSNVATDPRYLDAQGLGLSDISCAGPLDTAGFDKVTAGADGIDADTDQWQLALGNEPDYLTVTSATLLIRPGIGIPPMIGVVRGTPERQQIETAFLDALDAAGVPATRIDATSLTHAQVNNRIGAAGDTVMTEPIVTFLTDCFDGRPSA